jgi:hypothetical protein
MPITIDYVDNGLGIVLLGEGVVTGEEWIQCNKEMFSSIEKLKKCRYGIIDYTKATKLIASEDHVRAIVQQDKMASEFLPKAIVAVVAQEDLEFGLSRKWETVIEMAGIPWETMVFRNRDQAEAWIKKTIKERYNIDLSCA